MKARVITPQTQTILVRRTEKCPKLTNEATLGSPSFADLDVHVTMATWAERHHDQIFFGVRPCRLLVLSSHVSMAEENDR